MMHPSRAVACNLLSVFNGLMFAQHASLAAGAAVGRSIPIPLRAIATGIPTALHSRDVAERAAVQWLRWTRGALLSAVSGAAGSQSTDPGAARAWASLSALDGSAAPLTPDFRGFFAPWRHALKQIE